jgi:hypothetical protein
MASVRFVVSYSFSLWAVWFSFLWSHLPWYTVTDFLGARACNLGVHLCVCVRSCECAWGFSVAGDNNECNLCLGLREDDQEKEEEQKTRRPVDLRVWNSCKNQTSMRAKEETERHWNQMLIRLACVMLLSLSCARNFLRLFTMTNFWNTFSISY